MTVNFAADGATHTISCPIGEVAISGGFTVFNATVRESRPFGAPTPTAWAVAAVPDGQPAPNTVDVYVVCADVTP
ncbi:hypothetical protein PV392_00270 [Streptomyces sp. ME03-5709C]|nr:hypothetical protein [Streptomyces sp. ME03-5709C]